MTALHSFVHKPRHTPKQDLHRVKADLSIEEHHQLTIKSPEHGPYCSQGFSGMVNGMHENTLPTWAAPDVVADDLNALAEHHRRLGITARDARALKRVANLIAAHDEHTEAEVA